MAAVNCTVTKEIGVSRIYGFEGSERGDYHMHYDVTQKLVSHAGESLARIGDYYYTLEDLKALAEEVALFQKQLSLDARETISISIC